jgi:DNA-binding NtrC family response regulator
MGTAGEQIRVLIREDAPERPARIESALRRANLTFAARRSDTWGAFIEALDKFGPDVVLSGSKFRGFDALAPIKITREKLRDVPVIVVAGALDAKTAAALIKARASDCIGLFRGDKFRFR